MTSLTKLLSSGSHLIVHFELGVSLDIHAEDGGHRAERALRLGEEQEVIEEETYQLLTTLCLQE